MMQILKVLQVIVVLSLAFAGLFADGTRIGTMFGATEGITYGVIVDCGSSGTRAHVFKWNSSLSHAELLHQIEPVRDSQNKPVSLKITPGLSSLRDEPESSSDYMRPIIEFILSNVGAQKETGVYVMGTAGMRLLDADIRLSIIEDVSRDLEDNYKFAKVDTSVISGSTEGVYQWISVNSKAKRFNSTDTYAIVEMGGASIQVTYQLKREVHERVRSSLANALPDALPIFEKSIVEPQISREAEEYNYKLVSLTWLGFGSNSARDAYVDLLVGDYLSQNPIMVDELNQLKEPLGLVDPCLPSGAVDTVIRPEKLLIGPKRQTVGFVVEDDDEATFKVELIGIGDYDMCLDGVRRMLYRAKVEKLNCKSSEPCAMSLLGTPFVPHDSFHFLGLGDFFYTTKSTLNLAGFYRREEILRKTNEICNADLFTLKRFHPESSKDERSTQRLLEGCFKAVWIDVFLHDGLMMPSENTNLETVGEINGEDIDWTLGAIMDKSLAIEEASDQRRQRTWNRIPSFIRRKFN